MPVAVAGALVVAVAVIGAFALRSPGAGRGAPLLGSTDRSTAARARPAAAHPQGGEAALAAVSADIGAGRRAQAETSLRRARALLGAGDMRVQVAGALLRYRPGEVDTAIGVLRALVADDDRAPVPALHLGLALLWSGQRAEATAELRGDALARSRRALRAHRRQRPAPVLSQGLSALGALALRARLARRSCARGPRPRRARSRRSSTTPTRSSSARARARASWPRRRSRSTPATSTRRLR